MSQLTILKAQKKEVGMSRALAEQQPSQGIKIIRNIQGMVSMLVRIQ